MLQYTYLPTWAIGVIGVKAAFLFDYILLIVHSMKFFE